MTEPRKYGTVAATVKGIWANEKMLKSPKQRLTCCALSLKKIFFELGSSEKNPVFIAAEVDGNPVTILPIDNAILAEYDAKGKAKIFGFEYPDGDPLNPEITHTVTIKTGPEEKKDLWTKTFEVIVS